MGLVTLGPRRVLRSSRLALFATSASPTAEGDCRPRPADVAVRCLTDRELRPRSPAWEQLSWHVARLVLEERSRKFREADTKASPAQSMLANPALNPPQHQPDDGGAEHATDCGFAMHPCGRRRCRACQTGDIGT